MPRPRKAPRDRLQITLTKRTSRRLRAFARELDRDISEVVEAAVTHVMDRYKTLPAGGMVVQMPEEKTPS